MKRTICFTALALFAAGLACAGTISVSQPVGGSFAMGAACPVHWTAQRVNGSVKVQLIRPGGALVGLLANRLDPGSSPFNWTVAAPAAAGESYRIRVSAMDNSTTGESEVFTIAGAANPGDPRQPGRAGAISDVRLDGASPYAIGGCLEVAWTEVGVGQDLKLQLVRRSGNLVGVMVDGLHPGRASYSWPVGEIFGGVAPAADNAYRIRVSTVDNSLAAESPVFSLADAAPAPPPDCLLDIRCEVRPADLVLTMANTPNGREFRVRLKVRVRHNLDRAVENITVIYQLSASYGPIHDAGGTWTIASLAPGQEWVQQVDQTFGELGFANARRPVLRPGSDFTAIAHISDPKSKFCDTNYENNRSSLTFRIPE
jgi:hypothetical protein